MGFEGLGETEFCYGYAVAGGPGGLEVREEGGDPVCCFVLWEEIVLDGVFALGEGEEMGVWKTGGRDLPAKDFLDQPHTRYSNHLHLQDNYSLS